jgi:glycosyltransferase involved in cell wall biosynthesis
MKKVLMIAAQYPPMKGSSGLQRVLKFSQYLPENGWQPIVLTLKRKAHEFVSDEQIGEIPSSAVVKAAWGLDAKRHLSIKGRYLSAFARPDRWATWWLGAVPLGIQLVRKYRPDVIWSTYPIATAHSIGHTISKRTGIPWVADFRDSMTEPGFPADPALRQSRLKVEQQAVSNASAVVFTAPSARAMYASRYPNVPDERWQVISNGYDEDNFRSIESVAPQKSSGKTVLVHSGLLDPVDRDPAGFFEAVRILKERREISSDTFEINLRATGFNDQYTETIARLGIDDIVRLSGTIPYAEALREMLAADGLILFQARCCNHQIPAKVYEYFRADRAILGLVDPDGDTGHLLRAANVRHVAPLEDTAALVDTIGAFSKAAGLHTLSGVGHAVAEQFSRRNLTKDLAHLFDRLSLSANGDN